ncbi:hypothetical protein Tco_0660723 [Tanacetum coccineum]
MPVRTRRQLATDPEMYELSFEQLEVWKLVDKPFGKMLINYSVYEEQEGEDQTVNRNNHACKLKVKLRKRRFLLQQSRRVVDPDHPEKVYHLRKLCIDYKQAPRAWYPMDSGFELTAISNAEHAGCLDTRKALLRIQFLGCAPVDVDEDTASRLWH